MKKNIVVIGSNSFTGSHFVDRALQEGHNVFGVSRSFEYNKVLLPYRYNVHDGRGRGNFIFHKLDLNHDMNAIVELIDRAEPSIVANFAAQGEVRNSWRFPLHWYQTNCMAMVSLAEALRDKPYIEKYLVSSTPEVYGSTDGPVQENAKFSPSTPYAASKLAGDIHLLNLHRQFGFPVVFTRAANVYGVHQQLYRIIPRTIIYLRLGRKIKLHGRGTAKRSFINISDVIDASWKVALHGCNGHAYHIAPSGDETSILSLVKKICEMMNFDFDAHTLLVDNNFGQDDAYRLDTTKIETELGWTPVTSLTDGISEMIKWINDNWKIIEKLPHEYIHQQ